MTQRVLFNGYTLTRPGASTRIDASRFRNLVLNGLGVLGLIGEAAAGRPRQLLAFSTVDDVRQEYVSGDLVEAAQMGADPGNDERIPAGAQGFICYKVNSSTQATYAHPISPNTIHTFTSRQYGARTNSITVALAVGDTANERVVTITGLDEFDVEFTETSPSLGAVGKFTIQYTGAGSAATMTNTATQLTTTVTGAASDDLTLAFADFPSLAALVAYINANTAYTASALVSNAASFDPSNLDAVSAIDIKTALTTLYARNFDVAEWVNANSAFVVDALTQGKIGPAAALTRTSLSGGARGTSTNTDWTNGLLAMRGVRINQLVPLVSENAVGATPAGGAGTAGDTYTIDSILAAVVAHAKLVSSTIGRNECQAWAGISATKTAFIAACNLQNSEHLVLFAEKQQRARASDGAIVFFPEWSSAVLAAGMRCGAPLSEPLTWKWVNSFGVSSDASWSEGNDSDVTVITLNGGTVINFIRGRGFRIDKCVTTFTKSDNDAYTEETVVQKWKIAAYNIRQALEDEFVGRGGTLDRVSRVPVIVTAACSQLRTDGVITDSNVDGQVIRAWRDIAWSLNGDVLSVQVTVSPTPGINFVLTTLVLVPAQMSGVAA